LCESSSIIGTVTKPSIQKEDFDSRINYYNTVGILLTQSALNKPDSAKVPVFSESI
jgi:hypothetical protein